MGMAAREESIPFILFNNNITSSKVFALCFRNNGGVMTLGGVDTSIHDSPISYIKLSINSKGFYVVKLREVLFRDPTNNVTTSLDQTQSMFTDLKTVIIDSGTTDTYFPTISKETFTKLFLKITGLHYSPGVSVFKAKDRMHLLPSIIYRFEDPNGHFIDVERPPSSYVETTNDGFLAFRIYIHSNGAVLGANWMNNLNIIFDVDRNHIGLADSKCT